MGTPTAVTVPDGFWGRAEVIRAADLRDIPALIELILDAAHVTQRDLAVACGFHTTQVSQYKRRFREPHLENIARLAAGTQMPCPVRQRLGLSPAAPGQEPQAEVKLHRILALAEYIGRTGDTSQLANWRLLATTGNAAEPWDMLSELIEDHAPRRESTADYLAAVTRGIYLLIGKLPAKIVERALTRLSHDICLLFAATSDPRRRRKLTVIAGETSYLAACCSVDLADFPAAMRQLDAMEKAAREAGDQPLAAMALDGRSHFEAAKGDHLRALHLIEQARDLMPADASPGTMAFLWLRTAEEHMYCRQRDRAADAWARAEACYSKVDLSKDRAWVRLWLSRDCFDSVRALLYAFLGRLDEAREIADRVAARIQQPEGKADAIVLTNVTLAQTQTGMFKHAAATGTRALAAMRTAETCTCIGRLGRAAATLRSRAADVPQVQAFLRDFDATIGAMIPAQPTAT